MPSTYQLSLLLLLGTSAALATEQTGHRAHRGSAERGSNGLAHKEGGSHRGSHEHHGHLNIGVSMPPVQSGDSTSGQSQGGSLGRRSPDGEDGAPVSPPPTSPAPMHHHSHHREGMRGSGGDTGRRLSRRPNRNVKRDESADAAPASPDIGGAASAPGSPAPAHHRHPHHNGSGPNGSGRGRNGVARRPRRRPSGNVKRDENSDPSAQGSAPAGDSAPTAPRPIHHHRKRPEGGRNGRTSRRRPNRNVKRDDTDQSGNGSGSSVQANVNLPSAHHAHHAAKEAGRMAGAALRHGRHARFPREVNADEYELQARDGESGSWVNVDARDLEYMEARDFESLDELD